jgi:hypothetical protein
MLYRKDSREKILAGKKTQTRRRQPKRMLKVGKIYRIKEDWYTWTHSQIRITRRFKQRLGDITQKEIQKEGYDKLEDFKEAWEEINGNWDPNEVVVVYEFKFVKEKKQDGTNKAGNIVRINGSG